MNSVVNTDEVAHLVKVTKQPLLAELRVKDVMIDRFRSQEKDLCFKVNTLCDILKLPEIYSELCKLGGSLV